MLGAIENIKNNLITILITALCSFLGFLLIGIFSDFLPVVLPTLQKLPIELYLKTILLLIILLVFAIAAIIILALKSKPSLPIALRGKFNKIPWSVFIVYRLTDKQIDTYIRWHCPIHKTILQGKNQKINDKNVETLYCKDCNKHYFLISKGAYLSLKDVDIIVRTKILEKISYPFA